MTAHDAAGKCKNFRVLAAPGAWSAWVSPFSSPSSHNNLIGNILLAISAKSTSNGNQEKLTLLSSLNGRHIQFCTRILSPTAHSLPKMVMACTLTPFLMMLVLRLVIGVGVPSIRS
jgi:hypothetical protein